jgi:predicted nucleic acid-binding protein
VQLVVDASTLVAEGLRARGRALIGDERLDLWVTVEVWSETGHELARRTDVMVRRGSLTAGGAAFLLQSSLQAIQIHTTVVDPEVFADVIPEATRRVPRDPNDAPTVALALALGCGILTGDYDFFGCGVPVWTVETLLLHLAAGGQ